LATLVDHSLLQHRESSSPGSVRFELLEVLRQYATEKLTIASSMGERDVGDTHAGYYLGFLRDQEKALEGSEQQQALADISLEMPNVRKAWRLAAEYKEVTGLAQALDSLALFYYMNSLFAEAADNFGLAADHLALTRDDAQNDLIWGRIRTQQGWFNFLHGQQQIGQVQLQESVEALRRYDNSTALALALGYLAVITYTLGDYEKAGELAGEGLTLSEGTQDAYSIGVASNILSQLNYRMGRYGPARRFGEQSLALARKLENPWSIGFALINLGRVAHVTGEYGEAESLFKEALATRKAIGDARGLALCRLYLGDAAVAQGDWEAGQQLWLDSLRFFEEISNLEGMSSALSRLGRVAAEQGQLDKAHDQYLAALRLANQALATPRVLDALTGLAALLAGQSPQKALSIAYLVVHHPAATQECRALAANLLVDRPVQGEIEIQPSPSEEELANKLAQLVADFLLEG
jgi:tetratricopeptide (TPR) repeat protein